MGQTEDTLSLVDERPTSSKHALEGRGLSEREDILLQTLTHDLFVSLFWQLLRKLPFYLGLLICLSDPNDQPLPVTSELKCHCKHTIKTTFNYQFAHTFA